MITEVGDNIVAELLKKNQYFDRGDFYQDTIGGKLTRYGEAEGIDDRKGNHFYIRFWNESAPLTKDQLDPCVFDYKPKWTMALIAAAHEVDRYSMLHKISNDLAECDPPDTSNASTIRLTQISWNASREEIAQGENWKNCQFELIRILFEMTYSPTSCGEICVGC